MTNNILSNIEQILYKNCASLVGFSNLDLIDKNIKKDFKLGISIAVSLDPFIINSIAYGTTRESHEEYVRVNKKLDRLSSMISDYIGEHGFILNGFWFVISELF